MIKKAVHRLLATPDFADISQEFEATNKAYFEELQEEQGDEMAHYSRLFKTKEEICQEIEHIKDVLFQFDTENAEIFANQISEIQDRETALALKNALADARSLYNVIGINERLLSLAGGQPLAGQICSRQICRSLAALLGLRPRPFGASASAVQKAKAFCPATRIILGIDRFAKAVGNIFSRQEKIEL